mgnify:CR=1 FL=1
MHTRASRGVSPLASTGAWARSAHGGELSRPSRGCFSAASQGARYSSTRILRRSWSRCLAVSVCRASWMRRTSLKRAIRWPQSPRLEGPKTPLVPPGTRHEPSRKLRVGLIITVNIMTAVRISSDDLVRLFSFLVFVFVFNWIILGNQTIRK